MMYMFVVHVLYVVLRVCAGVAVLQPGAQRRLHAPTRAQDILTGNANYDAGGLRVLFNLGDEPRWFKFKLGKAKDAKVRIARFMCALLLGVRWCSSMGQLRHPVTTGTHSCRLQPRPQVLFETQAAIVMMRLAGGSGVAGSVFHGREGNGATLALDMAVAVKGQREESRARAPSRARACTPDGPAHPADGP